MIFNQFNCFWSFWVVVPSIFHSHGHMDMAIMAYEVKYFCFMLSSSFQLCDNFHHVSFCLNSLHKYIFRFWMCVCVFVYNFSDDLETHQMNCIITRRNQSKVYKSIYIQCISFFLAQYKHLYVQYLIDANENKIPKRANELNSKYKINIVYKNPSIIIDLVVYLNEEKFKLFLHYFVPIYTIYYTATATQYSTAQPEIVPVHMHIILKREMLWFIYLFFYFKLNQ